MKEIIVQNLGVEEDEVTLYTSMKDDLKADSLDLVELVMAIEEEFRKEAPDFSLPDEDLKGAQNIGDVVEYIHDKLSASSVS